ncbi:MAG: hydrogenase maturation nickel metallochaperone HypA [Dehalococcoidales bacterium]|nr:hydrogenase maturation nickel metallochaperone HypA [Dehalococcoidales bacterium]
MHELAITQSILSIAIEQAEANHAERITKINITIGELSGIVGECVEFCFGVLSKGTIASVAALSFDRPPIRLRCRKCDNTFSPGKDHWICPGCRSQSVEIVSGRECHISSIEVD